MDRLLTLAHTQADAWIAILSGLPDYPVRKVLAVDNPLCLHKMRLGHHRDLQCHQKKLWFGKGQNADFFFGECDEL